MRAYRIKWVLTLLIGLICIGNKAYAYERLVPYPGATRIVILGDEWINGYGLSADHNFSETLGRHLRLGGYKNVQTMNRADNKDTVLTVAEKIPQILTYEPHIVILCIGSNDITQRRPLKPLYERLEYILKTLTDKGIKVVLVGMPGLLTREPYKTKIPEIYNYLVYKYQVTFYPNFLEGVEKRPVFLLPDGIHPNIRGTEMIIQTMRPVLEGLIKTLPTPKP